MAVRATPSWSRFRSISGRYPWGIASEIERKFLIETPVEPKGPAGVSILQGYLAIDAEAEVRLRRAGDECTLTVKRGHGGTRDELEAEIPVESFEELWPGTEGRRLEKTRGRVELDGGPTAEIDEYSGALEGLTVVEVEFGSESEAARFEPPAWFGREVTGERAWANQSLAVSGAPAGRTQFRLREDEDPGPGLARVIAARCSQAAAAVRRAGEAEDPAADVHEARKSIKKARSALRLLRGVLSEDEREAANSKLREASNALAGARDAEVKISTLEGAWGLDPEPYGLTVWRIHLEGEAEGHRGELTPDRLAGVAAAIETVGAGFRGRPLPASREEIAVNAGRSYRRGRRDLKRCRKKGRAEDFHDWRKRSKDLRYQLEILLPLLPEEFDRARKGAERLADRLGDLHDLDVLLDDLDTREMDPDHRGQLRRAIAGERSRLADECLEEGEKLYDGKSRRFTDRLGEALGAGA